ncbi:MAG: AAA family ATPase [Clostridiales Family XIII bacterium]|nr:AAA family ATPase [Clostridiales Family XIII bacterium]
MNIITGEELGYLKVPPRPRRQFDDLMEYLREQAPARQSVCALYGLRRTGKTTLILQAIRELVNRGVAADTIGYFTGQKGDTFDDLIIELEARKKLKYIFVDEVCFYANFLKSGSYLYDTLVRLYDKKVVIAGTNLLALYLAGKETLYDRCTTLRVPYLSFYEHCYFVLGAESPEREDFMGYLQSGGLFQPPEDIPDYVQTSIVSSVTELFETQPESEIFPWLKPESEDVDWKRYVNTILLLSSNYVGNKSFQVPPSLREDMEAVDAGITRRVLRDFRQYFSLTPRDREFRMKRTETVALLDFLTHCGVITVLPNLFDDTEPYRCYVQTPFLRFHFTNKLQSMAGGAAINENTPLFGNLLEAAVVSEYMAAHPEARSCFARTHYPPGAGQVAEIDLLDMDAKRGYEVKLTRSRGYKGFEMVGSLPELAGFQFELLKDSACIEHIYRWGGEAYMEMKSESLPLPRGLLRP